MLRVPTCTASNIKFKLKFVPLSTYLFVTVINILLPQYAAILIAGLFVTLPSAGALLVWRIGLGWASKAWPLVDLSSPISIASPSSRFFSSAMAEYGREGGVEEGGSGRRARGVAGFQRAAVRLREEVGPR